MLQAHIASWAVGFVLFVLNLYFLMKNQTTARRVTQMALRLFYVFILITGFLLVSRLHFEEPAVIKGFLGVILIGVMEMISTRMSQGKGTVSLWGIFVVALGGVLYYGYVVL